MKLAAIIFAAAYAVLAVGLCIVALRGRLERRNKRAVRGSRFEDFELMRN